MRPTESDLPPFDLSGPARVMQDAHERMMAANFAVRGHQRTSKGMSNLSHSVDEGLEEDLRAGMRASHSAWNFNGQVWYDAEAGLFREEVWVYHALAAERSAATIEELMHIVNDEFGWD